MSEISVQIRPFDPHKAGDAEWAVVNALKNRIYAELDPDDPPESVEDHARRLRSLPPSINSLLWAAWVPDGSRAMGLANFITQPGASNRHVAIANISVLPEVRRMGVATRLLRPVADAARAMERQLILTHTTSQVEAGEPFVRRIGGAAGLTNSFSQLDLTGLDRDLMRSWRARAGERARGFELGLWEGSYPDADLDTVLAMILVMNTAPRGELDMEDFEPTAELLREWDISNAASGTERWTMYVRHMKTGKIAGYTEVFWNPARPEALIQATPACFPSTAIAAWADG